MKKIHFYLLVTFILTLFVGCTDKKTTKDAYFSSEDDPIFRIVKDLCSNFDVKENSIFKPEHYSDCIVTLGMEPKRHLTTSVKSVYTSTNKVLYRRSLSKINSKQYKASFKCYNSTDNYIIAQFSGVFHTIDGFDNDNNSEELSRIDWNNLGYYESLNRYSNVFNEIVSGNLYLYVKNDGVRKPHISCTVEILENQVIVTYYWASGQKKLVKEYNRDNKEIKRALNYNDDGSRGNPMEIAFLTNDRWIGFSSNLYNTKTRDKIYLILRAEKEDWRFGKVFVCESSSRCSSDYIYSSKGEYVIDSSKHIRLYKMKNGRGQYSDYKLSIEGDSIITITGTYNNIYSSSFISDLNMKDNKWFKGSLSSKYNM